MTGDDELTPAERAVLEEGGLTTAAESPAAADDPLAQSRAAYERLVVTSLSVAEAAERLQVTPRRVRARLADAVPSLYGFKVRGAWRLPMEQFEGRAALPGWEQVVPVLPRDLHPPEVVQWLTLPNPDLVAGDDDAPLSPRDWLRAGLAPTAVAALAREFDHAG